MDSIGLSEQLMRRGWWDEAQEVLNREDVAPADRTLQTAALICRRECAVWAAQQDIGLPLDGLEAGMLARFDRYTVHWYFREYTGEGSLGWRRNARANARTD